MSQEQTTAPREPTPRRADKRAKLAFLAIAVVAAATVYVMFQRNPAMLKGWSTDLPAALGRAKQENRRVLVFFADDPPGGDAQFVGTRTLAKGHNIQAIRDGNFIAVKVFLDADSPTARQYRIDKFPTIVVISPGGGELARAEGRIGETDFLAFARRWGAGK